MTAARPALCMALDPLPSVTGRGRVVHRHCMLPAGHDGFHLSRDPDLAPGHRWEWRGEHEYHEGVRVVESARPDRPEGGEREPANPGPVQPALWT